MRAPACALWRAARWLLPGVVLPAGCHPLRRSPASCGRRRMAVDVFAALADRRRRQVVTELAARETVTATELARKLRVTRQAVAKHLAALADAGLAAPHREGRETRYRLTPEPLEEAVSWIASVGGQWDERLARLERHVGRRRAT